MGGGGPQSFERSTLALCVCVCAGPQKSRLRWTPELHNRFVVSVSQLGGPDKATPKGILKLMAVDGLTIYHIKNPLEYPLNDTYASEDGMGNPADSGAPSQSMPQAGGAAVSSMTTAMTTAPAVGAPVVPPQNSAVNRKNLEDALLFQMELQKKLHDQLESQRQLQMSLEAHGRYIASLMEQEGLTQRLPSLHQQQQQQAPARVSSLEGHKAARSTAPHNVFQPCSLSSLKAEVVAGSHSSNADLPSGLGPAGHLSDLVSMDDDQNQDALLGKDSGGDPQGTHKMQLQATQAGGKHHESDGRELGLLNETKRQKQDHYNGRG